MKAKAQGRKGLATAVRSKQQAYLCHRTVEQGHRRINTLQSEVGEVTGLPPPLPMLKKLEN